MRNSFSISPSSSLLTGTCVQVETTSAISSAPTSSFKSIPQPCISLSSAFTALLRFSNSGSLLCWSCDAAA